MRLKRRPRRFRPSFSRRHHEGLDQCRPTREFLDDVRFLSNLATGSLGVELAKCLADKGFDVTLVLGPTSLEPPGNLSKVERFVSAEDLFNIVQQHLPDVDCYVSSVAVADYRPSQRLEGKLKKSEGEMTLTLERTPDVLQWVGQHRRAEQLIVGFALESDPDPQIAIDKMQRKKCDMIVHNSPRNFGSGGGAVRFITPAGIAEEHADLSKPELARKLADYLVKRLTE